MAAVPGSRSGRGLLLLCTLLLSACGGRLESAAGPTPAETGEARRHYLLGLAYASGDQVPRDPAQAAQHFEHAARAGHPEAQYLAGRAFSNGEGVSRDPAWAARWYGKAARQGEPRAQYALGVAYGLGLGLPKDAALAYRWLLTAERAGVEEAGGLAGEVKAALTPAEQQAAQRAAERFHPTAENSFNDAPTVLYVQQRLSELEFDPGPVDGTFGPRTRGAILAFQRARREPADGALSEALLTALREGLSV